MKYIVVTSPNGRSFYLAKEKIGGGAYTTIATFQSEETAKKTAALINASKEKPKSEPAFS